MGRRMGPFTRRSRSRPRAMRSRETEGKENHKTDKTGEEMQSFEIIERSKTNDLQPRRFERRSDSKKYAHFSRLATLLLVSVMRILWALAAGI